MVTIRPDVTILGAGLMGRLLAHTLAERGMTVDLYDAGTPDAQGAAARVAAAMLAPLAESAITELPVVRMGVHALARWPQIVAALPEPVFLQREGTVIVWHRQDAPEARRFAALLDRTARALPGLPGLSPAREVDAAGLDALEPVARNAASTWNGLAVLVSAFLQEQRRRDGQAQDLQQKLDALLNLERNMTGRESGGARKR